MTRRRFLGPALLLLGLGLSAHAQPVVIRAGRLVDPASQTPVEWRELARSLTGETAPESMTDGAPARYVPFSSGFDPGDPVDRAIMRTRTAVFAAHGLLAHP